MLDFIVTMDKAKPADAFLHGALALAQRHQAFVTGAQVIVVYPALLAVPAAADLLASEEHEAENRRAWWLELCRKSGLGGEWEVIRGLAGEALAKRSQLSDLVIGMLPVSNPASPVGFDEITRTLFAGVAPMLLVPDTWSGDLLAQRVLIAWNGSSEAVRAIKAALPLLRHAAMVQVLDGERDDLSELAATRLPLLDWLARHGVHAHYRQIADNGHEAGKHLLDEARAMQADLLVMGAWGRSRFSELVLGGATRHVLENAHLPVLLSR